MKHLSEFELSYLDSDRKGPYNVICYNGSEKYGIDRLTKGSAKRVARAWAAKNPGAQVWIEDLRYDLGSRHAKRQYASKQRGATGLRRPAS